MIQPYETNEDTRGVHLMIGEFTLCGDAFDACESEHDWEHGRMGPTKKRTITCPECVETILICRSARIKKTPQ